MLHRADAHWTPGRSDALRKLKRVPDEDARVIAHLPGKGRHPGRLGTLLLEMPSATRRYRVRSLPTAITIARPRVCHDL